MSNVPMKDDNLDDFDDDDWGAQPVNKNHANAGAATMGKGGPNPVMRQQVNAARPMTSGNPGQRGFHGIGSYKPMGGAPTSGLNDEDFDDMLEMAGGPSKGVDPLTAINQKKAQK